VNDLSVEMKLVGWYRIGHGKGRDIPRNGPTPSVSGFKTKHIKQSINWLNMTLGSMFWRDWVAWAEVKRG